MADSGLDYFIDDLDSCINEVVISEEENSEIISDVNQNNIKIDNYSISAKSPSPDKESYLSESTDPMTDSEVESISFVDFNHKIKQENVNVEDLRNQMSFELRQSNRKKRKYPFKELKIESKVLKTASQRKSNQINTSNLQSEYYIGKILWAKVKSHPWWPCMIFKCPDGNFYKELTNKKIIHVAYFGPFVERGWVNVRDIMVFEGKSKFDDHVKKLQDNNTPKYILQQFSVSASKMQMFTESWKEAEEAMLMSLEDRIDIYGISYKDLVDKISSSESDHNSVSVKESSKDSRTQITTDNYYEYERLKLPIFSNSKRTLFCFLCIQDDENQSVISCAGGCGQQFHVDCIVLLMNYLTSKDPTTKEINYNKCVDCNRNARRCFVCQKLDKMDKKDEMMKCSTGSCGRYYHFNCLYNGPYQQLINYNRSGSLTCPSHTCHSCYMDNPETVRQCTNHIKCLMCPGSFHKGQWCIPAGSKEINSNYIICPQHLPMGGCSEISVAPFINCIKNGIVQLNSLHFKILSFNDPLNKDLWKLERPLKASKSKANNVSWCFICSKGGNLICCERCPASFHQKCADVEEVPEFYVCEECQMGKYPRYGDVYWLKIGSYRWWPGQIIHYSHAPERVLKSSHGEGQFLVQFFGSNDYHWMNKTHAFPFEEGDELNGDTKKTNDNSSYDNDQSSDRFDDDGGSKLDRDYRKSLKIAAKVLELRQSKWELILGRKSKPSEYRSIKVNIPIGNVRINKIVDLSKAPQCECRPEKNSQDPCGRTSDCMNRELMYECHPQVCRNGDVCRNQRFTRREYPKQEVFLSSDRGWGLKILQSVKKGDFVNEYVGEVIDELEAARRLKKAHDSNVTNFYMMELDNQRIIDAGPSANLSRFMNHSCSPNLYTEKWTVNGDTRIGLFALHDIQPNEELTFNYNFFSLGQTKIQCKCGASNCSGFLGDPPKVASSSDIASLDKTQQSETKKSQNLNLKKNTKKLTGTQKKQLVRKNNSQTESIHSQWSSNLIKDEENCFVCGQSKCQLTCSYDNCAQVYHLECVYLRKKPKPLWLCPLHYCDDCGVISNYFCSQCPTSYCNLHFFDQLIKLSNEYFICHNHEDLFISQGSPTDSQNGSTNATVSINGTDSLPSVSI